MRRNRPTSRYAYILVVAFLGVWGAFADVHAQSAGAYAAPFLKIPVGARLMASPDAVAGLSPDASLMFSNPAFMTGLSRPEAFVATSEWLDNLVFTSAGVGIPVGQKGTVLGIGATFLYSGNVEGYDSGLNLVSEESYYDVGFDFTVSHAFRGTGLSLAAGTTIIRQHVLPNDGSGYAFHAGASYWLGRNLLHLAARDLGGSVSFDSESWNIASEVIVGGGRVFDSRVGQFFAGAQVADSDAYGTRLQLGVDYQFNSALTLRSGLTDNLDNAQASAPFMGGFGLNYGVVSLEYAYTPQEYFSSVHTFSLSYAFGSTPRGMSVPATVPSGDFSPPIADSEPSAHQPGNATGNTTRERTAHAGGTYVLLAGSHAWLESARAEVRALELLKIPAKIESNGTRYRVVVGRYKTPDDADSARREYASAGHAFTVVAE